MSVKCQQCRRHRDRLAACVVQLRPRLAEPGAGAVRADLLRLEQ